jgi:hypothetical protein
LKNEYKSFIRIAMRLVWNQHHNVVLVFFQLYLVLLVVEDRLNEMKHGRIDHQVKQSI